MGEDNMNGSHDEEMDTKLGERANNYMKELIREKHQLDPAQTGNAMRLLDDEIKYVQTKGTYSKDRVVYLNVYKDKPVKISAKVLVPVKEHPKFNFLGKLLGPKGNSLKRLQEDTMTKMSILGRSSMKDKDKEEELRSSLDPKYAHLSDDLHVEVTSFAPPAEAYARLAYALAELKKYLVPDSWDEISTEQRREAGMLTVPGNGGRGGRGGVSSRGGPGRGGGLGPIRGRGGASAGRTLIPSTRPPPGTTQGPPSRALLPTPPIGNKVLSILDKARQAMNPDPPPHQAQYHQEDSSYYDGPPSSVHQMDYGHSQPSASDSYYNHPPVSYENWRRYRSVPFPRKSYSQNKNSLPQSKNSPSGQVSSQSSSKSRGDRFEPYKKSYTRS